MPVTLSIKNVPDELAESLRRRAVRAHRLIQGELMAILEETLAGPGRLDAAGVLDRVRALGLVSAEESAAWLRAERDRR